jgi:hypothetical protein
MELTLLRTYTPGKGTNGELWYAGTLICHTIELPWLRNEHNISCIPEGQYQVNRCFSTKFGWHLSMRNVPGRKLILMHPANDAMKELRGCIAPVMEVLRPGIGYHSVEAMKKVTDLVFPEFKKGNTVYLTINSLQT